jgi:hypothetical protein
MIQSSPPLESSPPPVKEFDLNITTILGYVTTAVSAWSEFEAGKSTTFNVPMFSFVIGATKIDIGPFTLPFQKG